MMWYNAYNIYKSNPYEYKQFSNHNISIALDSPKGLVVPNIKNCQNLSIMDIHEELNRYYWLMRLDYVNWERRVN